MYYLHPNGFASYFPTHTQLVGAMQLGLGFAVSKVS